MPGNNGYDFRRNDDGSITISVKLSSGYYLRGGTIHWDHVNENGGYPLASLNLPQDIKNAIGPASELRCDIKITPIRPNLEKVQI